MGDKARSTLRGKNLLMLYLHCKAVKNMCDRILPYQQMTAVHCHNFENPSGTSREH